MKITKEILSEMIKTELSNLTEAADDKYGLDGGRRRTVRQDVEDIERETAEIKRRTAAKQAYYDRTGRYYDDESTDRREPRDIVQLDPTGRLEEDSVESETHRNRVVQASGVLRSKMESLVDEAFFLADELDKDRMQTRLLFKQAAKELQNFQSNSNNPVTRLVINKLKFLKQPGVLIDEIGDAIIALDE